VNNNWLDIDVLEDYLDGKLDAKAMHFVERQALEDPFVADALEGLRQSPKRKQTLSLLQKQLQDRITNKPVKRKMWSLTTHRLSIAATAAVVFVAVSILFYLRETNRRNEIAKHKTEGVIVNLDTNTTVAVAKPKPESISTKTEDMAKLDLIDEAIKEAKKGDLAKNNKAVPVVENVGRERVAAVERSLAKSEEKEELVSKEKKENYAARKMQNADVGIATVPAPNAISIINGKVISERDGLPILGAVVKIAGTNTVATTDKDGNFRLPVDTTKAKNLTVDYLGYQNVIAAIDDKKDLRIALKEEASALNEVVVTGYGTQQKKSVTGSVATVPGSLQGKVAGVSIATSPVPSSDYEKYLRDNNRLIKIKTLGQEVKLGFRVRKNGRPDNIKVISGITEAENEEAIRLINEGPAWVLPKKGTDQVELSIKF